MVRARLRGASARLWLDGIVAALAAACLAAVFLFEPLIGASAEPGSLLLTDVAYPVGDLLLLAVVTGVFGLTGWRPGRSWAVIGAGFVAVAIADGMFLYQATLGSYVDGALLDALWPASTLLLGWAAWVRDGRAPGARHHRPALDDRARRLHADRPCGARLRQPGQGPQRPRRRARDRHAARRDPAHGPDLRRQRPDGRRVDARGADRRADRPRQPPPPDARPRGRPRRPRRAHDRAVRPRRLQELQRRLRPPRRRRAARPPRPRARARGRAAAARPTASAATSSASCSTASTTRPSAC